jgi:hypothetical protein
MTSLVQSGAPIDGQREDLGRITVAGMRNLGRDHGPAPRLPEHDFESCGTNRFGRRLLF